MKLTRLDVRSCTKLNGVLPDLSSLPNLEIIGLKGSGLEVSLTTSCPLGSSSTFEGVASDCPQVYSSGWKEDCNTVVCYACPPAKYRDTPIAKKCLKCPLGTFCPAGSTSPSTPCPDGSYCPNPSIQLAVQPGFVGFGADGQAAAEGSGGVVRVQPCPAGNFCSGGVCLLYTSPSPRDS